MKNPIVMVDQWVAGHAERLVEPWLLSGLARLVFAAVLAGFFWHSAMIKLGDGVAGIVNLSPGAYAQIVPWRMEAVGYDIGLLGPVDHIIAISGTAAEFVLPALIVFGLFTRPAALGMIAFIIAMSAVDIWGHGVDASTIGTLFDRHAGSPIADQRVLWAFPLLVLVVRGAGPLSLDYVLASRSASQHGLLWHLR